MARVHHVKHTKTDLKCSKCGTPIKAARIEMVDGKRGKKQRRVPGDPYRWAAPGFRGRKKVRCMEPKCSFRPSELTNNDKLSRVYAAQEGAEDSIASWDGSDGSVSDLTDALETAKDEIKDVAAEYRESADNIHNTFSESPIADECEEKADALESWADEIENAQNELRDWDGPDEEDSDDKEEAENDDLEDKLDEALKEGDAADAKKEAVEKGEEEEPTNSHGETREEWVEEMKSQASDPFNDCPV